MKIGDLVRYRNPHPGYPMFGIVVEKGVFTGRRDVKILWTYLGEDASIRTARSGRLEVIGESR